MQSQAGPTQNEMVDIVCMEASRPLIRGRLVSIKDDVCRVDVGIASLVVPTGASTIVSFPSGSAPRIVGQVLALEHGELAVSCEALKKPERREYPRMIAGIPLRCQKVEDEVSATRWLAGGPEANGNWAHPTETLLNFSVTGLCFDAPVTCEKGDLLLLEFTVGTGRPTWRASGRVMRMEGSTSPPEIAIAFEDVPDEALAALTERTLAIQAALL